MPWTQTLRTATGDDNSTVEVTLRGFKEAIRVFCTECCGFETHPKECKDQLCSLWMLRGKSNKAIAGRKSRK